MRAWASAFRAAARPAHEPADRQCVLAPKTALCCVPSCALTGCERVSFAALARMRMSQPRMLPTCAGQRLDQHALGAWQRPGSHDPMPRCGGSSAGHEARFAASCGADGAALRLSATRMAVCCKAASKTRRPGKAGQFVCSRVAMLRKGAGAAHRCVRQRPSARRVGACELDVRTEPM